MKKSLKMIQVSALILAMGSSVGVARGEEVIRKLPPAEQAALLEEAEKEEGRDRQATIQVVAPSQEVQLQRLRDRLMKSDPQPRGQEIRALTPAQKDALLRQAEKEEGRTQATIQEVAPSQEEQLERFRARLKTGEFTSGTTWSKQPRGEHIELYKGWPEFQEMGKGDSFADQAFTDNNECPECGLDEKQIRKELKKEMLQRLKLKASLDKALKAKDQNAIQNAQKELDANQVRGLRLLNRSRQLQLEAQQKQLDSKKSADLAAKSCAPGVQDGANAKNLQRAIEGGLSSPDVPSYGTGGGGARSPAAANVND